MYLVRYRRCCRLFGEWLKRNLKIQAKKSLLIRGRTVSVGLAAASIAEIQALTIWPLRGERNERSCSAPAVSTMLLSATDPPWRGLKAIFTELTRPLSLLAPHCGTLRGARIRVPPSAR
jgi:hypothetical protein